MCVCMCAHYIQKEPKHNIGSIKTIIPVEKLQMSKIWIKYNVFVLLYVHNL